MIRPSASPTTMALVVARFCLPALSTVSSVGFQSPTIRWRAVADDHATLEPFYDVNDKMMGVSGLAGDPAYLPKSAPMPLMFSGLPGETLAQGFNQLGGIGGSWIWPSTQTYDGRDRCINLGACGQGCAQVRAALILYWPHAQRAGVSCACSVGCGRSRQIKMVVQPERSITTGG